MIEIHIPGPMGGLVQTKTDNPRELVQRCWEEPFLADAIASEDYVLVPKRLAIRLNTIFDAARELVGFWDAKGWRPIHRERRLTQALKDAVR